MCTRAARAVPTFGVLLGLLAAVLLVGGLSVATARPAAAVTSASPTPTPTDGATDAPTEGGGEPAQETLVTGQLRNGTDPVPDVRISVERGAGGAVGEARTGPDGRFTVPIPEAGDYRVTLDTASLPDGVTLREGTSETRTVRVGSGQSRQVLFPLGESTRQTIGKGEQAIALAADGVRFGLMIALAAVGLSLIFGTTGLTNFAHGELITLGAVVAWVLNVTFNLPFILAAILTVVICGAAGGLLDVTFWSRLRRRGTGLIAMMIVSIGLSILVRYLFLYFFGGSTRSYADYATQPAANLGPISLAPKDLISMAIATVVLLGVAYALLRTRIGKATRAVADNPALAAASGIDVERVIQVVWVAGAALAGLSGVLLGLNQQVSWQMGFQLLLLVFAAVTLGGLGTAFGALLGSLVVGLFIQLSTLVVPPELKNVGALGVLILILLVRPQGILGRAQRVG